MSDGMTPEERLAMVNSWETTGFGCGDKPPRYYTSKLFADADNKELQQLKSLLTEAILLLQRVQDKLLDLPEKRITDKEISQFLERCKSR